MSANLDKFEIGTPAYIISPGRKALWKCSYKFTAEDLDVIYRTSETHEIAFGKTLYVPHPDGIVEFECWHPKDTIAGMTQVLWAGEVCQWLGRKRSSRGLEAVEILKCGHPDIRQLCLVGFYNAVIAGPGYVNLKSFTGIGTSYAEAIEQGIFQAGLEEAGKIFGTCS